MRDYPQFKCEPPPSVDIDSLTPEFCIYCSVRPVDPDRAPYCSAICAIEAEHDQ